MSFTSRFGSKGSLAVLYWIAVLCLLESPSPFPAVPRRQLPVVLTPALGLSLRMKGRRASFKRAPKRAPPPGGRARAATRPFASAPSTADRTPPEIENFLPKGDALVAFLPEGKWFDNVAALPAVAPLPTGVKNAPDLVLAKMKRGLMLYEALVQKYEHGAALHAHSLPFPASPALASSRPDLRFCFIS